MGPRLLAYGGVRFSERRRIGEWPAIPEGTLRDPYGLQAACWSFGAGTAGGSAFLILRRLQRFESRSYAYTLLLDPGERVWNLFEWNGAAIIDALIQPESGADTALFANPEECTESALQQILGGLMYARMEIVEPGPDRFQAMLAGSAGQDHVVVAGLTELGLTERPQTTAVSGFLQQLPPCFRVSRGWLVGGGSLHGDVLGAGFVIDDSGDGVQPNGSDAELNGRRNVTAWNGLLGTKALAPLVSTPLFAWPVSPKIALNAVALLSDLQDAAQLSDELLMRIRARNAAFPEIDAAIEGRKVELLLNGNAQLGPALTVELTETALATGLVLREEQTARLHAATLIDYLVKRFDTPAAIPQTFPVPRDVRLALWRWAIEHTADGEGAHTFAQAVEAARPEWGHSELAQLVKSATAALVATDESLAQWTRFQAKPNLWPLLEGQLRHTALHRLRRGVLSASEDYLQAAGDPGGYLAAGSLESQEQVERLVRSIWQLLGKHPALVRTWIEQLAESPLRSKLSIGLKGEFTGLKGWNNLAVLKEILSGEAIHKDSIQANPADQEFLITELWQLPAPKKPTKAMDARLKKLLGRHWTGFPEQAEIAEAPPTPERSSGDFVRLFRHLLFDPPEGDDAIQSAVNGLRAAHGDAAPPDAMEQAGLLVLEATPKSVAPFLERFGRQYLHLGNVMEYLPPDAQQHLIHLLDAGAKGKFSNQAMQHLRHALDAPVSRNSYSMALGKYVLEQPDLLKKVAGRMGDMEPARLARSIKEMVNRRPAG